MFFGIETEAKTEPSSGRTVRGKEGGEGLEKTPTWRTLT